MVWKLTEAENNLSEVVTRVEQEGPQVICRQDDRYVIVSERHYRELTGELPSFKSLLLNGPSLEELELSRDRSLLRGVNL